MPSSTSSSDPREPLGHGSEGERRAGRFLAALVLLVLACEGLLGLGLGPSRGRHEVDERVARASENVVHAADLPRRVLLTDSVSYRALPPDPDVLDLSSNRALTVTGNHLLLARLLERAEAAGAGVERVVYCLAPRSFEARLEVGGMTTPYFSSVFTRREERDWVQAFGASEGVLREMDRERRVRGLLPPSYLRRGHLLRPLAGLARDLGRELRGSSAPPVEASPACRSFLERQGARTRFALPPVAARGLEALAETCAAHGCELWLVTAPLPPGLRASWEHNGFWAEYVGTLDTFARTHPGVRFLEHPGFQPLGDASFYDGEHLVPAEKQRWGRSLAELLARP